MSTRTNAQGGESRTIVVCGTARCGTSLVMKMLHRGGIEPLCDPPSLGYGYEYDLTTELPGNYTWLENAKEKAIKILDPHVLRLPKDRPYLFILLERDNAEQAKSHVKFLRAIGVSSDQQARKNIERSLRRDGPVVRALLSSYPNSRLLVLQFERVILDPLGSAQRLDDFLQRFDFDVIQAAHVVIERSPKCLPYLLEERMEA